MSRGKETILGYIDVAALALSNGDRKTASDMAESALESYKLFKHELTREDSWTCLFEMRALAKMLTDAAPRTRTIH